MKRLVICCDGTWNRVDQEDQGKACPTNVVKLAYRVAKHDKNGVQQVIFYDQGVGTGNILDKYSGGALGKGLEDNIWDAYRFLIANYELGDEIYVFGFSRGAFTARSIVGMIRKCGILDRLAVEQYSAARNLYRSPDEPDETVCQAFRAKNSISGGAPIPIQMIGVWDTVGALGIPVRGLRALTADKYEFHDTELSGTVKHAYHALAIDERRVPFLPTLWDAKPKPQQQVEQVWFAGVHTDVGGGYPEAGLSDITLSWMIEKAEHAGLVFDRAVMKAHPLHPDPTLKQHNSKTGLYALTPGADRVIGRTAKTSKSLPPGTEDLRQTVDDSVLVRWMLTDWRPPEVASFLKRRGIRFCSHGHGTTEDPCTTHNQKTTPVV